MLRTRFVELEGCANFRDAGGYPTPAGLVAPGLLFRSDSLHRLTERDLEVVAALGIRHAIDLRSPQEIEEVGSARLPPSVSVTNIPTVDRTLNAPLSRPEVANIGEGYEILLREAATQLAEAIRHVATVDGPVVVFCMAGKDRTGLLSALVQGLLGADDADIVSDYALTEHVIDLIVDRITAERPGVDDLRTTHADLLSAAPDTMRRTLEHLRRRFGGFAGYGANAGLTDADLDRLRGKLVVGL